MNKFGKIIAAALAGSVFFCFPAFADKLDSGKQVPVDLYLDASGEASWSNGDAEPAEKYDVELYRLTSGEKWDKYKTKSTSDESCEFSIGKTGYYRIRVRAHFYDDTFSSWAEMSGRQFIDEDDTSGGGVPDDWGFVYSPGPGYDKSGVPLTPGPAKPIGSTGPGNTQYSQTIPGYPNSNNYNNGFPAATSNTGWAQGTKGWWYKYANGSYPANTWERINDKWYFFNSEGYMQTGWVWWNNSWYLCLPDGQMATGWRNVNERWYYLNPSGVMLTGYQVIDGKTYYLDATGARVQNGVSPDGHHFDANGVMIA